MPQMAPIMWAPLFSLFISLTLIMLMTLFFSKKMDLSTSLISTSHKSKSWAW